MSDGGEKNKIRYCSLLRFFNKGIKPDRFSKPVRFAVRFSVYNNLPLSGIVTVVCDLVKIYPFRYTTNVPNYLSL